MHRSLLRVTVPVLTASAMLAAYAGGASAATKSAVTARSSEPTYDIAYEGPLSGGNAQLGLNMKFAVQLAINQANAGTTFGKLKFKLAFTEADDQGSASQSPTAAQSLITNSKVVAVVGPAFSGATEAAEPAFHAANLATVSPSATNPTLATKGWTNFFRVVADDNAQGPADALYISKVLGDKKVYSVDDGSTYGSGLVSAFDGAAGADGLSVTHQTADGTTQCQAGTGDVSQYSALASQINSSGAKAVFYGGYYCDFALLAKALRTAGYSGQLMSDDGSLDPHYVSEAGTSVADGTLLSCACATLPSNKTTAAFVSGFKKLAKFPVGTYSAEAYDATNTIIKVMSGLSKVSRVNIVKGLHSVKYQGLTKSIHFQPNGDIAGKAVYVYKVQNGAINQLGLISTLAAK